MICVVVGLHGTLARNASIRMPAISPVMKEGTIARWKKMEGEAFAAGDVLLQIASFLSPIVGINSLMSLPLLGTGFLRS